MFKHILFAATFSLLATQAHATDCNNDGENSLDVEYMDDSIWAHFWDEHTDIMAGYTDFYVINGRDSWGSGFDNIRVEVTCPIGEPELVSMRVPVWQGFRLVWRTMQFWSTPTDSYSVTRGIDVSDGEAGGFFMPTHTDYGDCDINVDVDPNGSTGFQDIYDDFVPEDAGISGRESGYGGSYDNLRSGWAFATCPD